MNKESVLNDLHSLVKTKLDISMVDKQTFEQSSIVKVMKADSLDLIRFVVIIENKFGVDLPDEAISNIGTFGDLADAICVATPL